MFRLYLVLLLVHIAYVYFCVKKNEFSREARLRLKLYNVLLGAILKRF